MKRTRTWNDVLQRWDTIDIQDEIQQPPTDKHQDWLIDALKESEINPDATIEKPPVLFSIVEVQAMQFVNIRVFTLGNFSAIIGKAKSKKTFLLSAISAAIIGRKTLWKKFKGDSIPEGKVLYFDTEQGDWDAQNVVKRICYLAGGVNTDNFKAWGLRQYSPIERCEIIEYALKVHNQNVTYVVIDGIADLASAINDEEEATRVTTLLLRWTKEYNCHISTVIHQNKNDNFATGHLGSAIMKKCEIILSVTKDAQDFTVSYVECDYTRSMDFKKFKMQIDYNGFPVIDDVIQGNEYSSEYFESKINDDVPF
jgi:hypothetical protein